MSKQVNNSGSNNSYSEFIPDQLPDIEPDPLARASQVHTESTNDGQYFESDVQSVGDILQASNSGQYVAPVVPSLNNSYSEPPKPASIQKIILLSALLGVFCAVILIIIISLN